jgi:hypothetical protein
VATKHCRVVYFETPVNPTMELIDMRAVREVIDELNAGRADKRRFESWSTIRSRRRIASDRWSMAWTWWCIA